MAKKQTSKYQTRTCECFARAMEQYWAIKTDNKELMAEWDMGNHPTEDKFKERVMPLIDKFLTENDELLKAFHKEFDNKKKIFI
jgi:predicted DNA-binding WGR domain protein